MKQVMRVTLTLVSVSRLAWPMASAMTRTAASSPIEVL
jgi:hypothetical protein